MSGSIRKKTAFSATLLLVLFVLISFAAAAVCIRFVGSRYQKAAASEAVEFVKLTIDADEAKFSFTTREESERYESVKNKIKAYQNNNSDIIKQIALVSFSNSSGSYIYDSAGHELGTKLEYNEHTSGMKAELINGRNPLSYTDHGALTVMVPVRTVDDNLCGFIVVELTKPFEYDYFPYIAGVFGVMLIVCLVFSLLMTASLNKKIFQPIKRITDSAVYLSGDDSVSEGRDASIIFNTKRTDEIGRLGKALQKILFDMNSGAEHLSQALYDANHDGMTQHLNKRCYHSMEESFRNCEQICVIYFDVNNLKLMNDTNGHESGDFVIKRAADYIRAFVGNGDYCFRMGGDEFLIVMTESSYRTVDKIMGQLDKDSPYILSRESDDVKCSLSYGCAFAKGEYSYDELLAEAEENMYEKKAELKKLLQMPDR